MVSGEEPMILSTLSSKGYIRPCLQNGSCLEWELVDTGRVSHSRIHPSERRRLTGVSNVCPTLLPSLNPKLAR
jgi:hypothetical protein